MYFCVPVAAELPALPARHRSLSSQGRQAHGWGQRHRKTHTGALEGRGKRESWQGLANPMADGAHGVALRGQAGLGTHWAGLVGSVGGMSLSPIGRWAFGVSPQRLPVRGDAFLKTKLHAWDRCDEGWGLYVKVRPSISVKAVLNKAKPLFKNGCPNTFSRNGERSVLFLRCAHTSCCFTLWQ